MAEKQFKYSEMFYSFQGEGAYTGKASVWIRFFLCSLQCNGFGQVDPTKPETYIMPYQTIDATKITRLEDLPVFELCCDSSYSWSAKFKHLQHSGTAIELCDRLEAFLPEGKFKHPVTGNEVHWCITGGEPLMKHSQPAIVAMAREFKARGNYPKFITIETNGTQVLKPEFIEWAKEYQADGGEIFFSVSPKLWAVAGETRKDAIFPEVVKSYFDLGKAGQLKFVVRNSEEAIAELDEVFQIFRDAGVMWDVYAMPVGATKESQETQETADLVVKMFNKGYHISGRLHAHLLGNAVGV